MQTIDLFREAFPETFDGKPARLQVFKSGKWKHPAYGEIEVKPSDLETMVANFEGTERAVPIDYNHGTTSGTTPEQQRAAGWLRNLKIEGEALWADVDLTPEAHKYVSGGEYRFVSPTFVENYKNKESGKEQGFTLLAAALTNTPFIDGMHPAVALSERAAELMAVKQEVQTQEPPKQEVIDAKRNGRAVFVEEPGALRILTEVQANG